MLEILLKWGGGQLSMPDFLTIGAILYLNFSPQICIILLSSSFSL